MQFAAESVGEYEFLLQNRALVEKVEALAEKKGCTTGQLAIAWLLHKSPDVIPLFGTKSIKNIEDNIVGARINLTLQEFAAIDSSISSSEVGLLPVIACLASTHGQVLHTSHVRAPGLATSLPGLD